MLQGPTWVINILWIDEAHFTIHGDVNTHNCRIYVMSNLCESTQNPLHSPKITVWFGFTSYFMIGPFFETDCPKKVWKATTVNAECY